MTAPAAGLRIRHASFYYSTMLPSRFAKPALRGSAAALALLASAACARNAAPLPGSGPLRAVATTGMIADIVGRVGGDRVEVTGMMGPGVDPHLYKATPGDVRALTRADIVFYNGLHLEAAMGEVLEHMGERARTVPVTRDIPAERLLAPPEFAGQFDPHVWFDVTFWMSAVGTVADALAEADPAGAPTYAANAQRSAGAVVTLMGNSLVQGSIAVDGGGGITVGSSGRNLVYDARVFPMIKSFGAAAPVQGTWRELPAS